jgi:hypothetical protein
MGFHDTWYRGILLKFVDTFQFWIKVNKKHITGRLTCISAHEMTGWGIPRCPCNHMAIQVNVSEIPTDMTGANQKGQ